MQSADQTPAPTRRGWRAVKPVLWVCLVVLLCAALGDALGSFYLVSAPLLFRAQCRVELPGPAAANRTAILLAGPGLQRQAQQRFATQWTAGLLPGQHEARVDVRRVPGMDTMLDIAVDTVDGDYAMRLLTELLARHDERSARDAAEAQRRATVRLERERDSLQSQLGDARAQLQAFRSRENVRYVEAQSEADEHFLSQIARREAEIRMEGVTLDVWGGILAAVPVTTINDPREPNAGATAKAAEDPDLGPQDALLDAAFPETAPDGAELAADAPALLRQVRDWRVKRRALEQCRTEYRARLTAQGPDSPQAAEHKLKLDAVRQDVATARQRVQNQVGARMKMLRLQLDVLEKAAQYPVGGLLTMQQANYEMLEFTVEHLGSSYRRCYADIPDTRRGGLDDDSMRMQMIEPPASMGRLPLPGTRAYAPLAGLAVGAVIGVLAVWGWRRRSGGRGAGATCP